MNGFSKETWIDMWKPEMKKEAGMMYDALSEIHNAGINARKKYVTKTQAIIFILSVLAFEKVGWPFIAK